MKPTNHPAIRVASAPVSWGVMEETDSTVWPSPGIVLGEIAAAGYDGTELGPYGYYPNEATALSEALNQHRLTLASAFVPLHWFQPERLPADIEGLMRVAQLLRALDCAYVVVADAMALPDDSAPSDSAWRSAAAAMEGVARRLEILGLRVVFHLEAGSHLATPDDEARLCALTDPRLIGICLDTGHYAYSFGNPRDAIRHYGNRVRYIHLKDVDPVVRERVAREGFDFYTAVRAGVFTPLGCGCADIAGIVADLKTFGYAGWVVAEQDILLPLDKGRTSLENARKSRAFLQQLGI